MLPPLACRLILKQKGAVESQPVISRTLHLRMPDQSEALRPTRLGFHRYAKAVIVLGFNQDIVDMLLSSVDPLMSERQQPLR